MEPENAQTSSSRHKSGLKLKDWDEHILKFLETAGLDQAARGFKLDVMVMNHNSEKRLLVALEQFCSVVAGKASVVVGADTETEMDPPNPDLDEIKQRYLPAGVMTPSQASRNTKAISRFLSDVRARTDQSNRDEFVRRKHPGKGSARTDAVKLNRDVQMKYDIVKNEDGPLGKTMKTGEIPKRPIGAGDKSSGVNERFQAVETHLGLRYVPAPPADYMLRVKHIEEHIIRLEKEYPPWAALHFNQPNRGWPPPPRDSIIVIPPHLTSSTPSVPAPSGSDTKGKHRAGKESSLLRAALDKLEFRSLIAPKKKQRVIDADLKSGTSHRTDDHQAPVIMAKKAQNKADQPPLVIPNRDLMQRMNFLYQASATLARSGAHPETGRLARKHVKTIKGIASGAVVKIDPSVKRMLCKGCNAVLVPGSSASVRVKTSRPHGRVISYTCFSCREVRVIPAAPTIQSHQAPQVQGKITTESTCTSEQRAGGNDVHVSTANDDIDDNVQPSATAPKTDQHRRRRSKARPVPFFARVDAGHVIFRSIERMDG
ncbi:molybdopterin synthase, partial [Rhizoctonia solani]